MKHITGIVVGLLCWQGGYAAEISAPLTLDKVNFQLSSKAWVSTQTALLSVTVNASLDSSDVVQARSDMLDKLRKIAPGDWHIVQFDRFQDSSGLEKLSVRAQLRVNQSQLAHLYDKAKNVSKPGETYQIASIEFKPDLIEIENAKALLRQNLNKQIQQELVQLNKTYTEQHFTVSTVGYQEELVSSQEQPMLMATGTASRMARASAPVAVSNELVMTAVVEAGSVRK
ncbi:MAG: hypothetical protein NTU48_09785 [Legionellales bacterium]|nr:hypothetical protein [Legionellales bacterium]